MHHEGSLPCSQEPATGPCPESDAYNPHLPTLFLRSTDGTQIDIVTFAYNIGCCSK